LLLIFSFQNWGKQGLNKNMLYVLNKRQARPGLGSLGSKSSHIFDMVIFGQWDYNWIRVKDTTIPLYAFLTLLLNQIVLNQIEAKKYLLRHCCSVQGYESSFFFLVFWNFIYYQFFSSIIKQCGQYHSYSEPWSQFFWP
jgi:hypothetical protein